MLRYRFSTSAFICVAFNNHPAMADRRLGQEMTSHHLDPNARRRAEDIYLLICRRFWGELSGKVHRPGHRRLHAADRHIDGAIAIQVRDLDQTVIGNPAHDLIRLGLSLAMAARSSDLPGITTAHMLECMINGYEAAFAPEERGEAMDSSDAMPKTVKLVVRRAAGRSWKHLADERIEGIEPLIPIGKRFWPLTWEERVDVGRARCGQRAVC
jgi:hypothetical protein